LKTDCLRFGRVALSRMASLRTAFLGTGAWILPEKASKTRARDAQGVWRCRCLAFVAVCSAALGVQAQDARSAQALLADRLVATAKALHQASSPEQKAIARVLFEKAETLKPDDVELVRAFLELAVSSAADDELVDRLVRRVAELKPQDHGGLVELITLDALRLQTVAERVAFIRRKIDPDQLTELPKPVRAELAARAASWAFDANDTDSMAWLLEEALRVDPANGLAAALRYQQLQLAGADGQALAAAAIGWLQASVPIVQRQN